MSSHIGDVKADYIRYLYVFVLSVLIAGFVIPIVWGFFDHSVWVDTALLWGICLGGAIGLLALLGRD